MSERQDPEKYLILFKVLVVFNILYYAHEIKSLVGPGGVTLFATKAITLDALVEVVVKAVKSIAIGSSTTTQVDIAASGKINVGGATEPMVLGKSFMSDLMAKHTHESSVGPTTGISPSFVSKIQSSLSKKCFLG